MITFRNKCYIVREEDDGVDGNGVDLYLGFLVIGEAKSFGGTTNVAGGLKNNNGNASDKRVHLSGETLCSVDIPTDTAIYVKLNLIESDQTTDRIREAYSHAKLPVFGEGAFKGNFTVSIGNGLKPILENFATAVNLISNLLRGNSINTDDDYGSWGLLIINDAGRIRTLVDTRGSNCKDAILNGDLGIDGQWHDLARLTFDDGDNDIDAVIEIRCS